MDLEKAIQKRKEAAQLIPLIATPFGTGSVSSPAVGIGLSPSDEKKEYRLVFQLTSDADRQIVQDICYKIDIQELPRIEIIGQAFSLPSVPKSNISRYRPLRLGAHISPLSFIAGGTLGCFVRKITDPTNLFILSCTHVIAPLDECCIGDRIIQPGGTNSQDDIVAELDNFIPLSPDDADTALDAAIAKIVCKETLGITSINNNFHESVRLQGNRRADDISLLDLLNKNVFKIGSTTNITSGRITTVAVNQSIWYRDNSMQCHYRNLMTIESNERNSSPFSRAGDSGSLIYDEDGYAVGLLIGGTRSGLTFALPIEPILNRLGIELILS